LVSCLRRRALSLMLKCLAFQMWALMELRNPVGVGSMRLMREVGSRFLEIVVDLFINMNFLRLLFVIVMGVGMLLSAGCSASSKAREPYRYAMDYGNSVIIRNGRARGGG